MLSFLAKRIGVTLFSMFILTAIVFVLVNLEPNLRKLALEQSNNRMTSAQVDTWLEQNGYREALPIRYAKWIGNAATGDFGQSSRFRKPVASILPERLGYTGLLAFWVMVTMIPAALVVGVASGMREGSRLDRGLSFFSVSTTATPEYVSGILLTVLFASYLGWFKGVASAGNPSFESLTLPVLTMALYGMGYIARMTRASMAEVMTAQYIRTARLKGLPFHTVILRHALRNAMIAPFTVIMLQFPWLLTGVVIVEKLFNYKGFGWMLVEAAENNDINLLLGCALTSVVVVMATQLISDVGYVVLNPRIRVR